MIHPSQVRPAVTPSAHQEKQIAMLEKRCDDAIQRADASARWPAGVQRLRMKILPAALDKIVNGYQALGWRVARPRTGPYLLTIDRPEAT